MRVEDILEIAIDYFDGATVDQVIRATRNVVRDINASFMGIHKTVKVYDDGIFYEGYKFKNDKLTGTVQRQGAPNSEDVVGNGTEFTQELEVGDEIIIDSTVYIVQTITDDTSMSINRDEGDADADGLSFYKVIDSSSIELLGLEKRILRVIVDGYVCLEKKHFHDCDDDNYVFKRNSYNEISLNYFGDTIHLECLYALPLPQNKSDIIEFPQAYDGIFTNGIVFYLARIPKLFSERLIESYAGIYFNMIRDLSKYTEGSIETNYQYWNYHTGRLE